MIPHCEGMAQKGWEMVAWKEVSAQCDTSQEVNEWYMMTSRKAGKVPKGDDPGLHSKKNQHDWTPPEDPNWSQLPSPPL